MNLYQPTISGSLDVSGSVTINGTLQVASGSISGTASLALNSLLLNGLNSGSFVGTGSFNTFSGSVSSRLVTQENASGSFAAQSASLSIRVTNLEATSSTVSSSFASTSGSLSSRVTIIEGQDATTGSNNFTAPQQISDVSNAISFTSTASLYTDGGLRVTKDSYVSGTAYFNNVVVYGTSSIQYITSSQVNIGTNIITVNTDTPAVRFGGLAVYDSGSTLLTGSMLWDSEKNHWIYSNPSGSTYSGGMLISGPRASSLGNEVGTTACALMMGQGGDHITSSGIFSYGNATCFYGQSFISSSGNACFAGQICATNATFNGCVNIFTGNQIRLYNSAKNNWVQIESPLVGGDAAIDFKLTTQTGVVYINNTGVTCFSNAICAPRAELTSDASCVPLRLINGVITGGSAAGVTALYFGDAGSGVGMIKREKYAVNQANLVLYSEYGYNIESINACLGYNGVAFYTAGTKRLNIDGTGITCFFSTVCAPNSIIRGTINEQLVLDFIVGAGSYTHQSFRLCGTNQYRLIGNTNGNFVLRNDVISSDVLTFACAGTATFACRIGVAGAAATYPLTVYNGSNGTTAAFGGTTYGIRIDNDGTFSCGRSTIYGVDASFYGSYQPLAIGASNLFFSISGTDRFNIGTTGIACFACQVCATSFIANGDFNIRNTSFSTTGTLNKVTWTNLYPSTYNIADIGAQLDGNYYNGAIIFRTADADNANVLVERMRMESRGVTCFRNTVCTPVLRASRVISNSTQLFDSDFSLNAGVTRSVVLCGGIYTMGDFHLMVYGNAGTGMSTIRLSTAGYFANSNLLQFCELQRYTFGSMTISSVSNNGTSISFNIGNCSVSNNGTGFWRMISLNGDAENNCIKVFVL